MLTLPPFRLYGLVGCRHCMDAEVFMREKAVPVEMIVCNDDPIIQAGIQAHTKQEGYPVLLCRQSHEIITGFQPETYERVVRAYLAVVSASPAGVFSGGQLAVQENPAPAVAPPTGA